MPLEFEPWNATSLARFAPMVSHRCLQPEFERMLGSGLTETFADTYCPEAFRRIAKLDGEDVGFAFAFVLPTGERPFASIRVAVLDHARRRGIGAALHGELRRRLIDQVPRLAEIESSALVPNEAAEALMSKLGMSPVRRYWLMQRPDVAVDEPRWPESIALRGFDSSERDIERFVEVFNRSWKEQDHGVLATVEDVRSQIASGAVEAAGAYFAIHEGEPVGFVRGARHATRGEVAVIGVLPEWRGRGLGRALLRFGTRWLIERGAVPVTLTVDGKNERALTLYRREQFEVLRTRQIWAMKA